MFFYSKVQALGLTARTPGGLVFEAMTTEQPELIDAAINLSLFAVREYMRMQDAAAEEVTAAIKGVLYSDLFVEAKRLSRLYKAESLS